METRLDITVPSDPYDQLCLGALRVLQHVKKDWKPEEINFKVFTDGITNRLIGCFLKDRPQDIILIRVYGQKTELFIDRRAEVANMQLMHKAGLAAPVFCGFQNGLCYGYSPGTVLDEKLVKDTLISKLVAEEMARMHNIHRDQSDSVHIKWEACLFKLLHKYIGLVPLSLSCPEKNKRLQMQIRNRKDLEDEIVCLEAHLTKLESPTVYSHNDLLLKNILYDKENDKVTFIDFEYAAPNYQAFDIGNHFCEFAGVETFMPELYPDKQFQYTWLRNYLQAKSNTPVSSTEIELLYVQVNKFALASHLMWGLWALIQAAHSTLDFDFLGYASQRIGEYFNRKEEFLSLKPLYRLCSSSDVSIPSYTSNQNETTELKRSRLLYQSRKRGMLENGLLLGSFASKYLPHFTAEQLKEYDIIINLPSNDWDLYYWMTGLKETPVEFENGVMKLLKNHCRNETKESRYRQPDLY